LAFPKCCTTMRNHTLVIPGLVPGIQLSASAGA